MAQSEKIGVQYKIDIGYWNSAHIPRTETLFRSDAAKQLRLKKKTIRRKNGTSVSFMIPGELPPWAIILSPGKLP